MNTQMTRARTHEQVRASLLAMSRELDDLGGSYACVLHCMQPHRNGYYAQLEKEFGVRILRCSQGEGVRATVFEVALGASGVMVVKDYGLLQPLFLRISEQAFAALYVIKSSDLESVLVAAQRDASRLPNAVEASSAYLVYQVDEDSATDEKVVVEMISVAADCPRSLKEALGLNVQ
jgi:hypothetical protein